MLTYLMVDYCSAGFLAYPVMVSLYQMRICQVVQGVCKCLSFLLGQFDRFTLRNTGTSAHCNVYQTEFRPTGQLHSLCSLFSAACTTWIIFETPIRAHHCVEGDSVP